MGGGVWREGKKWHKTKVWETSIPSIREYSTKIEEMQYWSIHTKR
jgi:hypothetical protein